MHTPIRVIVILRGTVGPFYYNRFCRKSEVLRLKKYVIHGGRPLYGKVEISGAKNAAVGIIPAALLVEGPCRIENIPEISDVDLLLDILKELGGKVRVINRTTVEVDCSAVRGQTVPYDKGRKLRASYYLLGAMLGRFGAGEVPLPGGCDFGSRPIDQHLKGFAALGATVEVKNGYMCGCAEGGRLKGNQIYLDVASVGATMNLMLAGVLAKGTTIIENTAKEPHIVDLANFLNSMGADITGAGTDVIKIRGVEKLRGESTPSSPTKSRRAPIWPPWPPPGERCGCATSSPSTWSASPPSWWRWGLRWTRTGTR